MRRGVLVLAAAFALIAGACSGDDVEVAAFDGRAEVVAVEPNARPAEAGSTGGTISGAVIVDEAGINGLDDCAATDDGFRVFVDEDTSFTPSGAADDLESLRGETVRMSGRVTKRDDVCTPVAETIAAQDAGGATSSPGDGDGGASVGTAPPGGDDDPSDDATSPPEPTTSPNDPDDEGSITDPDETTSPRPENDG